MKLIILLVLVSGSILAIIMSSCSKDNERRKTSEISTDITELSKWINLPYQPKAVWWQVTRIGIPENPRVPGPVDWKLEAVLLFDKKDVEAILKKSKPITPRVSTSVEEEIAKQYEKLNKLDKSPDFLASEAARYNLLKEHGELEDKCYEPTLFMHRQGILIRIKGADKLYISYTTS